MYDSGWSLRFQKVDADVKWNLVGKATDHEMLYSQPDVLVRTFLLLLMEYLRKPYSVLSKSSTTLLLLVVESYGDLYEGRCWMLDI